MNGWWQSELTALAFCWRLQRRDGIVLGFTSHDRDLELDGLAYRAAPGMVPSAIEQSVSLEPGSVELSGVLTSDALVEADFLAGRWEGARLQLRAVDWTDPDAAPLLLVSGALGSVELADGSFRVELRGATDALDDPVVEYASPQCRAELGDRRCRVAMAGRVHRRRVIAGTGGAVTLDTALVAGLLPYGSLRWLDGPDAGLRATIIAQDGADLLLEPRASSVESGTLVELTEGCDRQFSTCRDRFDNAANFRGEPHVPGNDLLMRYASG